MCGNIDTQPEEIMGGTIEEIIDSLKKGQGKRVTDLVKMAVDEGISSQTILEEGFLAGMEQVSDRFDQEEVGVPEILSVTRALDQGVEALRRYTGGHRQKEVGTVVIGTVNGDLHDMGKNLVKLMMQSKNIQVIDLGVDVSPSKFYRETKASKARVVILSGILPSTDEDMREVIDEFELQGARDQVYFMVGGGNMNEQLAAGIGADCYTEDAGTCAEKAYQYLTRKEKKRKRP